MRKFYFILFIALAPSLFAAEDDVLKLKNGDTLEVFITKESPTHIEYKDIKTGAVLKKHVDDVAFAVYKDAVHEYQEAIDYLERNNFSLAIKRLKIALGKQKESRNNWHKDYIYFYMAYGYYGYAKANSNNTKFLEASLKIFTKISKTAKKTRCALDSKFYMANIQAILKKYPEANALLTEIDKFESKRPRLVAKSTALKALILKGQGKNKDAVKLCSKLVMEGNASPELPELLSSILIDEEKDYKQAKKLSLTMIKSSDKNTLRGAYEFKANAEVFLKEYESALDSVLMSQLLYGDPKKLSHRSNFVLALSLKALMAKKADKFPKWEYNNHYIRAAQALPSVQQKNLSKLKF
ncbi:MAG: hypothetical protein HQL32_02430 [Planctomycetes bacterium]|nr:hypothetical protein [Planctomycetota bacterium]